MLSRDSIRYLTVPVKISRVKRSGHLGRNHTFHKKRYSKDVHPSVDEYLNSRCVGKSVVSALFVVIDLSQNEHVYFRSWMSQVLQPLVYLHSRILLRTHLRRTLFFNSLRISRTLVSDDC